MSNLEKRAASELAIWAALLVFLWMRLTDGVAIGGQTLGLAVVDQPATRLLWTYLAVGVLAALAQMAVRQVFAPADAAPEPHDERDRYIERKADQFAYWTGFAAANVLVVHVLLTEVYRFGRAMPLDLASPAGLVLALVTLLLLQELARGAALLFHYRRS